MFNILKWEDFINFVKYKLFFSIRILLKLKIHTITIIE